jgi:hypothetical protein
MRADLTGSFVNVHVASGIENARAMGPSCVPISYLDGSLAGRSFASDCLTHPLKEGCPTPLERFLAGGGAQGLVVRLVADVVGKRRQPVTSMGMTCSFS